MISKIRPKKIATGFVVAAAVTLYWTALFTEAQSPGPPAAQPASPSAQSLDYEFYKTRVEPILIKKRLGHARCYACHSYAGRAGGGQPAYLERLSPGSASFTDEQSRRNFQRVSQWVVPGKPDSSPLLMHPLAPEAGGDAVHLHGGGRQFESQTDPDWETLADWVSGKKAGGSSGP